MKRFLISVLVLLLSGSCLADGHSRPGVEAVFGGLRPVNSFEGDPTWSLQERMEHYGVPGVGIAVIKDREVIWHEVVGLADRVTGAPVTSDTLFQAGSISKPVSAYGAMMMVESGDLKLDESVNKRLKSWKIPASEWSDENPVTLTHLTSHTGGLTVHGFPGYAPGVAVPTLVQVLDGVPPANTPAIFVNRAPGEGWRYSGGGYTVMQQLMIDVGGKAFPALMEELVLGPLNMRSSTFEQPLPPGKLKNAGAGVLPNGSDVPGKRHTYPEMAAAGLWTTAYDLALFAADVQQALNGDSEVLSKAMAEAMVEPVDPTFGRGFSLESIDGHAYFEHGGWDEGFCAQLTASRDAGVGVAVMINSNHPQFLDEVVKSVAMAYDWPGYRDLKRQPMPSSALSAYPGRYRYNDEQSISVTADAGRLFMQYVGEAPQELIHIGDNTFARRERGARITFSEREGSPIFEFMIDDENRQRHVRLAEDEFLPRDVLVRDDEERALQRYRALIEADGSSPWEAILNDTGLEMAGNGFSDLGLKLLRINAELFPESANTWDSIGYVLLQQGHRQHGELYYRKALEIDPQFSSALQALAELEAAN
ncbi:MAG: serine hydrolase [Pseudomonadota bacterium]